jgi:23S rRNA (adenine2503-C2)-methyltransferase
VTFEYVLLKGVNDGVDEARRLAALIGRRDALLNLIPYNPTLELPYDSPDVETVASFADTLRRAGLTVKTRKRKGRGIAAACGQLRRVVNDGADPITVGLIPGRSPVETRTE